MATARLPLAWLLATVAAAIPQAPPAPTTPAQAPAAAPAASAPQASASVSAKVSASLTSAAVKASATAAAANPPNPIEDYNWEIMRGLIYAWVALIVVTVGYCAYLHIIAYARTLACMTNPTQKYFARPKWLHGGIVRKQVVDAPLFKKRHHREFRLSKAVDMGTLPSRLQTLFILAYIGVMLFLTLNNIPWNQPFKKIIPPLLRRSGNLALLNMLPLVLLAGRNNPLIPITGITFDTYNLMHRWLGRITAVEAMLHFSMWVGQKTLKPKAWAAIQKSIKTSHFIQPGFIALCGFVAILVTSPSPIRHAFYETFLLGHQILAATVMAGVWIHLKEFPKQQEILQLVVAIWIIERGIRLIRLVWGNIGYGGTHAEVVALPGEALRVTVKMARQFRFVTGAHAYIYIPGIGWWQSHPFSIAWSEDAQMVPMKSSVVESDGTYSPDILSMEDQTISFVIRRRTGFTDKLWKKAERAPGGRFVTRCFVEGPYGHQSLRSYGTVLLFAAGVGITHQVPHVRDLVTGYSNGTVAARKIVLIWIIQSPEHLEWIRPWMTTILSLPKRRECLKILLFVTRPRSTKEIHSPSSSVQMFPGRPNMQALMDQEVEQSIGAIGVSVCGTGSLADEVRLCCRLWMGKVNIDFSEESFSW